ncbi:toxin secretion/phage lysis holin [Seinonella peptonophila]|uniref:Toxin secretion/phage lysis holin n=1 Tax=Seinonella peptonophila TaxID=112248 RepID=A0A1M4ZS03_9BACL|nr:phage holin family protein [Seinonella peptonophila]SHF20577.1 toxin secretion/phage lysis holin [Seinonella peptonophila]
MENILKTMAGVFGAVASYLWGGWEIAVQILFAFVVIDYISGILAAGIRGELSSNLGFNGIAKKVAIFIFVTLGHLADVYLGVVNDLFRDGVITFFIANEALSIVENCGRMGLPVPPVLHRMIEALRNKGGNK